ncbi:MAG: hypothetical protein WCT10_02180 [Patescibacteria group bacterium]|jgi:hypothetical protein
MKIKGHSHKATHKHLRSKSKKTSAPGITIYCQTCDTKWQQIPRKELAVDRNNNALYFECWKCDNKVRIVHVAKDCYEQLAA